MSGGTWLVLGAKGMLGRAYMKLLRQWRDDGELDGLELT